MLVQNYKKIASYTYHVKGVINTHNSLLDFEYFFKDTLKAYFANAIPLHKKWGFPLRISSVNVTKSACELLKKSLMENFIFVQCTLF